jgi:hypothetical protein
MILIMARISFLKTKNQEKRLFKEFQWQGFSVE